MHLHKILEVNFDSPISSLLEIISKNEIIIFDSDRNFNILNSNLNVIKKIPRIVDFCMYNIYKSCNQDKILFSSSEDFSLLLINLITGENRVLNNTSIQSHFSRLYYWHDDYLILITRNEDFYYYDEKTNSLIKLTNTSVNKNYPIFSEFYQFYQNFDAKISINACEMSFIQFDESSPTIEYYNFKNNLVASIKKPNESSIFTDILYCKGIFVFVYEEILLIRYHDKTLKISSDPDYHFRKVRIIQEQEEKYLIIMSKSDLYPTKLQKYEIHLL